MRCDFDYIRSGGHGVPYSSSLKGPPPAAWPVLVWIYGDWPTSRRALMACLEHPSDGAVELCYVHNGDIMSGGFCLAFEREEDAVWFRMVHPEVCKP
jgi:hypothetical protein